MFNRFRDGLVYPKRVIQYRKDSVIRIILFMLMFALAMTSSTIVIYSNFDRIPEVYRDAFQDGLTNETIPCIIEDDVLTCTEEEYTYDLFSNELFTFQVKDNFNEQEVSSMKINFVFEESGLTIYNLYFRQTYTYSSISESFQTIDFTLKETDEKAFSNQIMDGIGDYIVSIKSNLIPLAIIGGIITNLFIVAIIALMNAFSLKMRFRIIPFGEAYKMGLYTGSLLYVFWIIISYFQVGIFTFVIFLVLYLRQLNQLSFEIMRIIKK